MYVATIVTTGIKKLGSEWEIEGKRLKTEGHHILQVSIDKVKDLASPDPD